MRVREGALSLSATDLANHLACAHVTTLDRRLATGAIGRPDRFDPMAAVLRERGLAHERAFLEHLRAQGMAVVELATQASIDAGVAATLDAMRHGADVIAQATLRHGRWEGRADVLRRIGGESDLGPWSYEVVDTKLARETRGGTVLQLCLYTELVAGVQGVAPERMYVVSPGRGFEAEPFRFDDYAAYYRVVKGRLAERVAAGEGGTYPLPTAHCDICRWYDVCEARWRADDHLSLVAGMGRLQERELESQGVRQVTELAALPVPIAWKPDRGSRATYERLRDQARLQIQSRTAGRIAHELLPVEPEQGLCRLPEPAAGDVFLDFEGDPFAGEGGMEYLAGHVTRDAGAGGEATYHALWALDRAAERQAFEHLVADVMARWARDPGLHVYHYAPYEPAAIKRLMGRYGTREDEVDRILRAGLFVDLHAVVRQGVRVGVESYSIKALEPLYDFVRSVDLRDAGKSLRAVQGALELGSPGDVTAEIQRDVEGYNRDDCLSALRLRDWLEGERAGLVATGVDVPRPVSRAAEPSEALSERRQKALALVARLTDGIPADPAARSAAEQAQWLLAHLVDWHRREDKVGWWELFRLADLDDEDRLDERQALAGLEFVEAMPIGKRAKLPIHRYRFPPQEVSIRAGDDVHVAPDQPLGEVVALDPVARTIDIKKRKDTCELHPASLFAHNIVRAPEQEDALLRLGTWVADHGMDGEDSAAGPHRSARDLLLRLPPRGCGTPGEPLRHPGEPTLDAARRLALSLAGGVLPVQGPPGTGKTYTAARMIVALLGAGRRVGITATSHKVIRNLLDEVVEAAAEEGASVKCIQKVDDPCEPDGSAIEETDKNNVVAERLASGAAQVAAGTAWLWARAELAGAVDALFVDEAGQMSLANVCAIAQAAQSLVLVGDPRQLEQPQRGSHPEGADVSALEHLLGDHATVLPDRGLFLEQTFRLHPTICAFTSQQFYEGRLGARPGCERHRLSTTSTVTGSGLFFVPVPHQGNRNASPEEVDVIADLVETWTRPGTSWIDADGAAHPIGWRDILIVAPYNAQVALLSERLPQARVGTVDKFQGQEAPIVVYSMATSTPDDAPRGMEFLYSRNRLNVATSRARCACVLVASPALFAPECKTPQQMRLANAHCAYVEGARGSG